MEQASTFKKLPEFSLTGLAGTGKTTTAKEFVELANGNQETYRLVSTDEIIVKRIKADDPVILAFKQKNNVKIPDHIFNR